MSTAIAHTQTEQTRSPSITVLTSQWACQNRPNSERSEDVSGSAAAPPRRDSCISFRLSGSVVATGAAPGRWTTWGCPRNAPERAAETRIFRGNSGRSPSAVLRSPAKFDQTRAPDRSSQPITSVILVKVGLPAPGIRQSGLPGRAPKRRAGTSKGPPAGNGGRPACNVRTCGAASALRRRRRCVAVAALGHELIELGLVLGERASRSRKSRNSRCSSSSRRSVSVRYSSNARLPLERGWFHQPATPAAPSAGCQRPTSRRFPATHSSAPDEVGQGRETQRPPHDEAQDHQGDPGRLSQVRPVSQRSSWRASACEC